MERTTTATEPPGRKKSTMTWTAASPARTATTPIPAAPPVWRRFATASTTTATGRRRTSRIGTATFSWPARTATTRTPAPSAPRHRTTQLQSGSSGSRPPGRLSEVTAPRFQEPVEVCSFLAIWMETGIRTLRSSHSEGPRHSSIRRWPTCSAARSAGDHGESMARLQALRLGATGSGMRSGRLGTSTETKETTFESGTVSTSAPSKVAEDRRPTATSRCLTLTDPPWPQTSTGTACPTWRWRTSSRVQQAAGWLPFTSGPSRLPLSPRGRKACFTTANSELSGVRRSRPFQIETMMAFPNWPSSRTASNWMDTEPSISSTPPSKARLGVIAARWFRRPESPGLSL